MCNRVERAVIMAAGKGERMAPITHSTPKPLVKVNGIAMIETVINALHNNGIIEIYVVVGYLKEQFSYLTEKYDNLTLIENPFYDSCNNISSLYAAREHIENAFILDGDQIIYNDDILKPEFEMSGYNGVWVDEHTDEWLMKTTDGVVTDCSRVGGSNGWQLFSISRWGSADGKMLKELVELEFEKNHNTDIYWDDVVMFCHPDKFKLAVYEMQKNDIIEIDSIDELKAVDKSYVNTNTKSSAKEKIKYFIDKHSEIWKFIKFTFTGASTSILEMVVFAFLQYIVFKSLNEVPVTDSPVLSFLKIEYKGYMYSYFISAVIGYAASYIMNRKLTFKADSNIVLSTVLYVIMVVCTIAFNTWFGSFLSTLIKNSGYDNFLIVMLTKLVVMTVPTIWTYPLQRFVIHRKKKENNI